MNLATQHLVIGATGKTGSRVMQRLNALGYHPTGTSRKTLPLNNCVHFDWHDPTTWALALTGVDSVYVTYFPDLAVPQAPEDISRFCALAKIKGIRHITLLSGRGEPAAQVCENIVKQSGISWTIVRAAWFNQNFSEGLFKQFIDAGRIALPVRGITEPFVDIDDIAEVVTASMTQAGHSGKLYEVTGPECLSFADLAKYFTDVLNRPVEFQEISLAQFQSQLQVGGIDEETADGFHKETADGFHKETADGFHKETADALTYLFTEVLDGRNEFITNGVQQALGRMPKSFSQYIQDNAHFFTGLRS